MSSKFGGEGGGKGKRFCTFPLVKNRFEGPGGKANFPPLSLPPFLPPPLRRRHPRFVPLFYIFLNCFIAFMKFNCFFRMRTNFSLSEFNSLIFLLFIHLSNSVFFVYFIFSFLFFLFFFLMFFYSILPQIMFSPFPSSCFSPSPRPCYFLHFFFFLFLFFCNF